MSLGTGRFVMSGVVSVPAINPKPNPRRTNGTRRDRVRARVLREESDCWLCGEPVDKTIKTPHPDSPEVDEVTPVSKGGSPYDRSNCRLAHRRCNRARGAGDEPAGVREYVTHRRWW